MSPDGQARSAPVRVAVTDDWLGVARGCADWSALDARAEVSVFTRPLGDEAAAVQALQPFDIILPMRERQRFPRTLLERLPRLKMFALTGFHAPHVDLAYCAEREIVCCGSGSYSPAATAELTLALMLGATRRLVQADANVRAGRFQDSLGLADLLEGRTLGIIGLGRIGARVARYGRALGMTVLAWSANLTDEQATAAGAALVAKDELISRSDIVSLHLILSPRSRHTLGARELALMKPGALLVNTARSGLIDPQALLDALQENRIRAALDVFEAEPPAPDAPLLSAPNTLLTPHLGFSSVEGFQDFYSQSVENILAFLDGAPIRPLPPPK